MKKKLIAMAAISLSLAIQNPMAANANIFEDIFEQGQEDQENQAYQDAYDDMLNLDEDDPLWPGIYYCTYSDNDLMHDPYPSIELMVEQNDSGIYATMYDYLINDYTLLYEEMYIDGAFMYDGSGTNNFTYDANNNCIYLDSGFYYGQLTFHQAHDYGYVDSNVKYYPTITDFNYYGVYYNEETGITVTILPMYNNTEYYVDISGTPAILHQVYGNGKVFISNDNAFGQNDHIDGTGEPNNIDIIQYEDTDDILIEPGYYYPTQYICTRIGDIMTLEDCAGTWDDGNGNELIISEEGILYQGADGTVDDSYTVVGTQYYHESGFLQYRTIYYVNMEDTEYPEIYMVDLDDSDSPKVFFKH